MAAPHRDEADVQHSTPVNPQQSKASQPQVNPLIQPQSPIDVIKEYVDTIHKASVDIPSSDELAQVLLCTQQLVDALHKYTQAQADRDAIQAELDADDPE